MSKYDGKATFDIETLTRIICCDCGLVHEVSFHVKGEDTFVTFERNDAETEKVRIERAGGKSKLYCRQLDEARARENLHPPEAPDAVKTEASSIGAILGKGEKWRPQLQK